MGSGVRVAVLAMPWRNVSIPALQPAQLAAWLQQHGIDADALHVYLDVVASLGLAQYLDLDERMHHHDMVQEALYAGLLFPERQTKLQTFAALDGVPDLDERFWQAWSAAHVSAFDAVRWSEYDIAVCCGDGVVSSPDSHYLAGVYAAEAIKRRAPGITVVLAGGDYVGAIGQSLLETVHAIDHVINGEAELPLLGLVQGAHTDAKPDVPGLLTRDGAGRVLLSRSQQLPDLDQLPFPDFDSYFNHAVVADLEPRLPIEGARGCWWDRSNRDPRLSCQFCSINIVWQGYRAKSIARITAEIAAMSDRYGSRQIFVADMITRPHDSADLFAAIAALGRDLTIDRVEGHVSLPWTALWQMKQAGVQTLQFGVEALAPALLKRMNKGTTFIRAVELLRDAAELGLSGHANLICDYPGSTEDEVAETLARLFQLTWLPPLTESSTIVGYGSPLARRAEELGLAPITNAAPYGDLLPEAWVTGLELAHKAYTVPEGTADWSRVRNFLYQWQRTWDQSPTALRRYYVDHANGPESHLVILAYDDRGTASTRTLVGQERRLFLYCRQARRLAEVQEVFAQEPSDFPLIEALLGEWVATGLVLHADDRYLSMGLPADARLLRAREVSPPVTASADLPPRRPRLTLRPNPQRHDRQEVPPCE